MAVATVEEIYEQVKALPLEARLRLVERIAHDVSRQVGEEEPKIKRRWRDIRGTAVGLLDGEDAQEWVSRTRREGDAHREKQWKREP